MATETLESLVRRFSLIEQERYSRYHDDLEPVSWDEIWEAAQTEGIIDCDISKKTRLISIQGTRRGIALAGDIPEISRIARSSHLQQYIAHRFPHNILALEVGYLIKGLPNQQQNEILSTLKISQQDEQAQIDSKGISLSEAVNPNFPARTWSLISKDVQMPRYRQTMAEILEIAGVTTSTIDRVLCTSPDACTVEEGMVYFSDRSIELLLAEEGLQIKADTSPLDGNFEVKILKTSPIEDKVCEVLSTAQQLEGFPWYTSFRGSLRKMLTRYQSLGIEETRNVWEKMVKNFPKIKEVVNFHYDTFKAQDHSLPPEEAFLSALQPIADLGSILITGAKEGIRVNKGQSQDLIPYTPGKQAMLKILDLASQDPEAIVGLQVFEERADTGLMLLRLKDVIQKGQSPVAGVVITHPKDLGLNTSIIAALKEI
ncbi:MAG: hypothetical protein M1142_03485 [Patescibacteria group bacterium]|nr:hypothetical protein [Patescibacteria group bacterium]